MPPDRENEPEIEDVVEGTETPEDADQGDGDAVEVEGQDPAEGDGAEPDEAGEHEGSVETDEKPRGRAEGRIQRLSRENRESREETAKLRRELDEFRAQQRPAATPGETAEMKAARRALMTPEERMEDRLNEAEQRNNQNLQQLAFINGDNADRANFNVLKMQDPLAARYADRVETKLAELRKQGQNVTREALLDYMVGQDVRSKRAGAVKQQKGEADKRIARQQAKPPNSKGDVAADRRGGKSLEERLEKVTF